MQFASARVQKPIESRCQDRSFSRPRRASKPDFGAKAEKSTISKPFGKEFLKQENDRRQQREKSALEQIQLAKRKLARFPSKTES